MYRYQFPNQADVLPWLKAQEDAQIPLFDANDWIYQTWAYDAPRRRHHARDERRLREGAAGDQGQDALILAGQKDLLNPSGSRWRPRATSATSAT